MDDPGGRGAAQEGEEAQGQQEAGEVVDGEPQLEPVLALLAGGAVGAAGADAGVVDEDVERVGAAPRPPRPGARTSSSEARSAWNVGAPPSSSLSASSFSRLRPWRRTCAPRAARSRATPRPSPSVAPVMRTVVSSIGRMPCRLARSPRGMRTYVRALERAGDRTGGAGPAAGLQEAVVRHFDAPEALDTRFYEVHAKSALNRVPKASRMPFPWTINPYRGCSHACVYCAGATRRSSWPTAGRAAPAPPPGRPDLRHGDDRALPALRGHEGPRPLVVRKPA